MNAIEKIHSLNAFGSRPGLDRIKRFLQEIGNPQNNLKFIHVAGTNGKGSVCALISSVLTEAGYKTGLFISPYITDFKERIQINGKMISNETLEDAVDKTFPILLKLRDEGCIITEFEYVMALEFYIHSRLNCDVVVLETGMGGLLDCTNVILPPLCTVITTIGLDHTAILGNTLQEIALQKCGIIKFGSTAVTSKQADEVMDVIENECKNKKVRLIKSGSVNIKITEEKFTYTKFIYKNAEISLPFAGEHQIENAKTALAAIEVIKNNFNITNKHIKNGFSKAVNPARFELLCKNPIVILDGAHNPNGILALKNAIKKLIDNKNLICIMGMLADKDSKSSIKILEGLFDTVYTVTVNNPRTLSAKKLAEECNPYFKKVICCDNPFSAFDKAFDIAKKTDSSIVILGSLYLAGEIRPYILSHTNRST